MKTSIWTPALVAFFAIFSSGCVEFTKPLSSEKDSVVDTRLIGVWEYTKDGTKESELIKVQPKAGSKTILEITSMSGKEGSAPVHTKKFGKHDYLSVMDTDKKGKTTWFIAEYEFLDKDSIRMRGPESDRIKELIQEKKIAGVVEKDDYFDYIQITEDPAKLAAFFEKHFHECFDHEETSLFKRATPEAINKAAEKKPAAKKPAATTPGKSSKK
ncbi:MAG: hypothetical protein SGJ20_01610 [Planctomycetota bacterium]|nr:hypothetical protein [Planctomycetota bacterium]